ncbi:hypothetical protein HH303_01325 [Rhodospirillaceae bacterium KN72]|uniref:Uncharacterized protein n=1 Tax=Pacificispira spongiicola TaxID=2729598 RepID=A0A7Y0DWV5_9PROT|nr:hypothetical protein [Pacificispira spongiicola]NMM43099.1 hypothetical protein [Pacificispira spongiicola]
MIEDVRFTTCEEIALEAERLLLEGYREASLILLNQVRSTCLFKDDPCPESSGCRTTVRRLERDYDL